MQRVPSPFMLFLQIEHERMWDWQRFTQAQLRVVNQQWQRDREELLDRALVTLQEAKYAHQKQLELHRDQQLQQDICSHLRDKVSVYTYTYTFTYTPTLWECLTMLAVICKLLYLIPLECTVYAHVCTCTTLISYFSARFTHYSLTVLVIHWNGWNWIGFLTIFLQNNMLYVDVTVVVRDVWDTRQAVVSDGPLVYSKSADEAVCYSGLPDSISRFSCHLGWAVNANKLIWKVLQTWCCCLGEVLVHIRTTNKLFMWTKPCTVDAVLYNLISFICQFRKVCLCPLKD